MIAPSAIATVSSLTVTACALSWAAFNDIRYYIIPNTVPVVITISFALTACFMPMQFLIGGLMVGLAVFGVGVLLFICGLMGGGDAKLLTAVAFWAGPAFLSEFAIVTSLSGAVLAALMLSPLRRYLPTPSSDALALTGNSGQARHQPMPFGAAIAAGGVFVLALYLPQLR